MQIASCANLMIGTSSPVVEYLHSLNPDLPVHLIENGVDLDIFGTKQQEPDDIAKISHPRAIYVGALDERFDFSVVDLLAKSMPELSLILIGPVSDDVKEKYLSLSNVHFLGSRPFEQIPGYLRFSDVALLPLSKHPANNGRSPMKIYEYGSCGLPVLASATQELKRRCLPFVFVANESNEFPVLMSELLGRDLRLIADCAVSYSAKNSWKQISDDLLEIVCS